MNTQNQKIRHVKIPFPVDVTIPIEKRLSIIRDMLRGEEYYEFAKLFGDAISHIESLEREVTKLKVDNFNFKQEYKKQWN